MTIFQAKHTKVILLCITFTLTILTGFALQAETQKDRPYWSFEIKHGQFEPDIDNWKNFYGSDHSEQWTFSLGFKILRYLEFALQGGRIRDKGTGTLVNNSNTTGGRVTYELFPLSIDTVLRGVFYEDQWVVPYIGIGFTQINYKETIRNQSVSKGSETGFHLRTGAQFLLDRLDKKSAFGFNQTFGVNNTYVLIEAQYTDVSLDSPSVKLGGSSYLIGLLFEF